MRLVARLASVRALLVCATLTILGPAPPGGINFYASSGQRYVSMQNHHNLVYREEERDWRIERPILW